VPSEVEDVSLEEQLWNATFKSWAWEILKDELANVQEYLVWIGGLAEDYIVVDRQGQPNLMEGAQGCRFFVAPWAAVVILANFGKNLLPRYEYDGFERLTAHTLKLGVRVAMRKKTVGDLFCDVLRLKWRKRYGEGQPQTNNVTMLNRELIDGNVEI